MLDGESWIFQNEYCLCGYVVYEFGLGEILCCWFYVVVNDVLYYVLFNVEINIVVCYFGCYFWVEIFGMIIGVYWFKFMAGEILLFVILLLECVFVLGLYLCDWMDCIDVVFDVLQDYFVLLVDSLIGQSEVFVCQYWLSVINCLLWVFENIFVVYSQFYICVLQGQLLLVGFVRCMQVSECQM